MSFYKINMEETAHEKWRRQRKHTVIVCVIIIFLAGLDYSIIMSTMVPYLKDLVQVDNPNMYYSATLGAFSLSSILVGTFSGRFVDRTRNLKMYVILVLLLMLIGNLLYTIYLHPAFLIVGRFLAGIGDSFMGVSAGELVRLHNRKDGTKAIWIISAAFSIGFTSGPVFGVLFKGINITIGYFVVNYLNFIGIFVSVLSFIAMVISMLLLPNKPLDLQFVEKNMPGEKVNEKKTNAEEAFLYKDDKTFEDENNQSDFAVDLTATQVFYLLLTNKDTLLIYVTSFISLYSNYSLDILLPLIIYDLLQWSQLALTITIVLTAVPFFVFLYTFSKLCTTDKREYYACLFSIFCTLICFCIIFELKVLVRNYTRDMWLMAVFVIGFTFIWFPNEVFLTSMLAKKVPPSIQSFAHGFRSSLGMIATVIPAFTTPLLMPWVHILSFTLVIVVTFNLVYFLMRRKSMTNIKVIWQQDKLFCNEPNNKI